MPEAAYRYRWAKPREGFAVFELRWSWRKGGLRPKAVDPPREVIAPKQLDAALEEIVEPQPKDRAKLVRELELLDPDDTSALLAYMDCWGWLCGYPAGHGRAATLHLLDRMKHEGACCLSAPGAPPSPPPKMPNEGSFVPYVRLAGARRLVCEYQGAVARYADLPELPLRKDARRAEEERLQRIVLEGLELWGGVERDPNTFLPLIGSPLATAWQRLAESWARTQVPRRCEHEPCRRPFTLAETDRRLDKPPRFCSSRCNLAAWRAARGKESEGRKRAPKRRGR